MSASLRVHLTAQGSLHLDAALVATHFPNHALVAALRPPELWLLPIRSSGGGGLHLKQRNRSGDCAVLIWEHLPPDTPPGDFPALWDDERKALRVALVPLPATA